jgi:hypothetical protein
MAQKTKPTHDPWKEMIRHRENNQVDLDEVLVRFSIEERGAQALKKALIARMAELARDQ